MPEPIRIATRNSPLALWQAESVRHQLLSQHPGLEIELVPMTTEGDRKLGSSLAKIGGKGLFIKELEAALYDGRADLAVHSMKDVTAVLPDGLTISTVLEREDPFDAFVSNRYQSLDELPENAIIGTCSVRRSSQLLAKHPKFNIKDLRGNVNTRLQKLDDGNYDAIVLACAGLQRLGMAERITATLQESLCLPAVGQGIIGIEIREKDQRLQRLLHCLHHTPTAYRLQAERAVSATLNGGCSAPIAGFTTLKGNHLHLKARVIALDGSEVLEFSGVDTMENAHALGVAAANELVEKGAMRLLEDANRIVLA